MELNRGNRNGDETTAPASASTGRESFDHSQGVRGWSDEFDCETIDGYLAPTPVSMRLPAENNVGEEEGHEPKKRKRTTVGNEELFFRVYKFPQAVDQYILEMHEVITRRVERSLLSATEESNGKWKVKVEDLEPNTYVVPSILHDPFILRSPSKNNILLQDRLAGWTVDKNKRRSNGRKEKFYYHRGKQFRSFVEVATFILFSTKSKVELKNVIQNPDLVVEASVSISLSTS